MGRDAVRYYPVIKTDAHYVSRRYLASLHSLCGLQVPVGHDNYILVSVHSSGQRPENSNCDDFERAACGVQLTVVHIYILVMCHSARMCSNY